MFDFFAISVCEYVTDPPLWIVDVDFEGNAKVSVDSGLAKPFETFYEASRFAALIDYPVVFVMGVIVNE